jgi:hypothetical protein
LGISPTRGGGTEDRSRPFVTSGLRCHSRGFRLQPEDPLPEDARTYATHARGDLPLAGRRRLHVPDFKPHPFSFRKTPPVFTCEYACAFSRATTIDVFLLENQQFSFRNRSASCVCQSRSPSFEGTRIADAFPLRDSSQRAGSSPSGARSVGKCSCGSNSCQESL